MFKFVIYFAFVALALGRRPLVNRPYHRPRRTTTTPLPNRVQNLKLCTYSDISYEKCIHTVIVAQSDSENLNLDCVRESDRNNCIQSVQAGAADMVVMTGHGYKEARRAGLKPFIFAKEDDNSLYIAVAPRNLTLIGLQEAPIYVDQSDHRAFHAATFFNLAMGHDICSFLSKVSLEPYISIVNSADYEANDDEILVCPNRLPGEFSNYKTCNVDAGLQRAVFINTNLSDVQEQKIRKVFDTIMQKYGNRTGADKPGVYNFFGQFKGQDDVIFKKNTISFDLEPTYRNGVNETVYNQLHCNSDDQSHDLRYLL